MNDATQRTGRHPGSVAGLATVTGSRVAACGDHAAQAFTPGWARHNRRDTMLSAKLAEIAKHQTPVDYEDDSLPVDCYGSNIDDAYAGGEAAGRAALAREILKEVQELERQAAQSKGM